MTVDTVGRFERALEGLEVGLERVPAAEATDRIEPIVQEPAVGAPLPFEGVALPDSVMTAPTNRELEGGRDRRHAGRLRDRGVRQRRRRVDGRRRRAD